MTFHKQKLLNKLAKMTFPERPVLGQVKILDDLDYPVFTNTHTIIGFKDKQFTEDTQIDFRTKAEKAKGVQLPDLTNGSYPVNLSRTIPDPTKNSDDWTTTTIKLSELLKTLKELREEPNTTKDFLFYNLSSGQFESDKIGGVIGRKDVMMTYKNLGDTLEAMKHAGATEELTFHFYSNPDRPFVIDNEKVIAILAPVRPTRRK